MKKFDLFLAACVVALCVIAFTADALYVTILCWLGVDIIDSVVRWRHPRPNCGAVEIKNATP